MFGWLQDLRHVVGGGMTSWYEAKMFIEHSTSVTSDAIHVITGVAIQLLVATLLRSSIAAWRPWLVVLVLACLNEAVDLSVERWPDPAMQYGESAKDILLTMFLPSILMIVSRFRPRLLAGAPGRRSGGRLR